MADFFGVKKSKAIMLFDGRDKVFCACLRLLWSANVAIGTTDSGRSTHEELYPGRGIPFRSSEEWDEFVVDEFGTVLLQMMLGG